MTLEDLLGRLDGVTPRGTRFLALCPAHADRSPSLQLTEGDSGLLLKCWAGCTLAEICFAIGVKESDLFYDAGLPRYQDRTVKRPRRIDRMAIAYRFELAALDRRLRAEAVLPKLIGLTITAVSDLTLDRLLAVAAKAYADLERAECFEQVADALRLRQHEQKGLAA